MTDLISFLLARIGEDEAMLTTRETLQHRTHLSDAVGTMSPYCPTCRQMALGPTNRGLVEVAFKRAIVARYADYLSTVKAYRSPRWADAMNEQDKQNARQAEARHAVAEDVARLLASVYSDHEQYRAEWAP